MYYLSNILPVDSGTLPILTFPPSGLFLTFMDSITEAGKIAQLKNLSCKFYSLEVSWCGRHKTLNQVCLICNGEKLEQKKNAPLSPERPPEMAPSSDGVASRAPSLGTFPGVSNWEGTGRRPRSHCWDCVSGGQECLRMPLAAMMSTGLVSREEM